MRRDNNSVRTLKKKERLLQSNCEIDTANPLEIASRETIYVTRYPSRSDYLILLNRFAVNDPFMIKGFVQTQTRERYFAMIRAVFTGNMKDVEIWKLYRAHWWRKLVKKTSRWTISSRKCTHHFSSSIFNMEVFLCAFTWKFATWSFFRFLAPHRGLPSIG